jgi:hypothetical protein
MNKEYENPTAPPFPTSLKEQLQAVACSPDLFGG